MSCEGFLDFYDESPIVKDNPFKHLPQDRTKPPALADVKHLLPEPSWAGHDSHIAAYWKSFEIAFTNLERPHRGNGFKSAYLATAFNEALFMWDSVFGLMQGKLGRAAFNFQRTLDNLYAKQHGDGFISREVREWSGKDQFHRYDPASTGPNVMGFSEWEYYLLSGDKERLAKVFPVLLAYHLWMRKNRTWPDGSYHSCGLACGMDNQPRAEHGENAWLSHSWSAWIDATAQALLSAKILLGIAFELKYVEKKATAAAATGGASADRDGLSLPRPESLQPTGGSKYASELASLIDECRKLTSYINDKMWDEGKKFYVDRRLKEKEGGASSSFSSVRTVGAYWALLAGAVPADRAKHLIAALEDPRAFNRAVRVPSLPATDPHYSHTGGYWLGGVWSPTSYLVLRGLTAVGTQEAEDCAADIARNYNEAVARLYRSTATLWENLAPEHGLLSEEHKRACANASSASTRAFAASPAGRTAFSSSAKGPVPGSPAKPDFVGWGGVPATTILLEYVFGFRPQLISAGAAGAGGEGQRERERQFSLTIDVRLLDAYGCKRYPFFDRSLDIAVASRGAFDEPPKVTVTVNGSLLSGQGAGGSSSAGAGGVGGGGGASAAVSSASTPISVIVKWGRRSVAEGGWSPDRRDYKSFQQSFTFPLAGAAAPSSPQELFCKEGGDATDATTGSGSGGGSGSGSGGSGTTTSA